MRDIAQDRSFGPSRPLKATVVAALAVALVVASAAPSLAFRHGYEVPVAAAHGKGKAVESSFRRHVYRGQSYHGAGPRLGPGWAYGAAGLMGLAGGALLDDAMAPAVEPMDEAVSYCANRFKSYDPWRGTYLGYDGREHPCP